MLTVGMLKKLLEDMNVPDDMEVLVKVDDDTTNILKVEVASGDWYEDKPFLEIVADY